MESIASPHVTSTQLRARFATALSDLYATEVPAYATLVQVSQEVNASVLRTRGAAAERLGDLARVTAERHGAIRVGSPREMAQVARIFAAMGMYPCGFYDLRDAQPQPIPVVSTAFRPLDRNELAINPFRVFTSMLVPEDRRFFSVDLEKRLHNFFDRRQLFPAALLDLADRAIEHMTLSEADATRFLELAVAAFTLSPDPIDRSWYSELERISSVAADIGGVSSTHINHLTPRVLDIDDLYASMSARGIEMIDEVQGPPRWDGPDVLLRQTSFRALTEPRSFRDPDGTVTQGSLRVRFGEVEARGIALTPAGRDLYDRLVAEVDRQMAEDMGSDRQEIAERVWRSRMPMTDQALRRQGLAYFNHRINRSALDGALSREQRAALDSARLEALVESELVTAEPIVYEDFLPRSAAGIFASNLAGTSHTDVEQGGAERDLEWMSDIVECPVQVPEEIYAAEARQSFGEVEQSLRLR